MSAHAEEPNNADLVRGYIDQVDAAIRATINGVFVRFSQHQQIAIDPEDLLRRVKSRILESRAEWQPRDQSFRVWAEGMATRLATDIIIAELLVAHQQSIHWNVAKVFPPR